MKLSISNIAWDDEHNNTVYSIMKKYGFSGLEIAPTRIIPSAPYDCLDTVKEWRQGIAAKYGFEISSMQSIWYGKTELLFGSENERQQLVEYTRKAVMFAEAIGCRNLVFGCPRNRVKPEGADEQIAVDFFREIGDFAFAHKTCIAMEANPPIYNTNYINYTEDAVRLIARVGSKGFKLNLDVGTMIENMETADSLSGCTDIINHVHISEPGLKAIIKRDLHTELIGLLNDHHYSKYISVEMGRTNDMMQLESIISYVSELVQ